MKEVTICFSFSVKDGLQKIVYESLITHHGWSIDGTKSIEKRKSALRNALRLLAQLSEGDRIIHIKSLTLRERKSAIPLDDLEAKNTAHAKGE